MTTFNICDALVTLAPAGQYWTETIKPRPFATCEEAQRTTEGYNGLTDNWFAPDTVVVSVGTDTYHAEYRYNFGAHITVYRPAWPGMSAEQVTLVNQHVTAVLAHEHGHANLLAHFIAAQVFEETLEGVSAATPILRGSELFGILRSENRFWQKWFDDVTSGSNDPAVGLPAVTRDFGCDWDSEITVIRQHYIAGAEVSSSAAGSSHHERWDSNDDAGEAIHELSKVDNGVDVLNEIWFGLPALGTEEPQSLDTFASLTLSDPTLGPLAWDAKGKLETKFILDDPGQLAVLGTLFGSARGIQGGSSQGFGRGTAILEVDFLIEGAPVPADFSWDCRLQMVALQSLSPNQPWPMSWNYLQNECPGHVSKVIAPGSYRLRVIASTDILATPPYELSEGDFVLILKSEE